ncbi:Zn-dependent exopeptidase [Coccomyxa subellipsoidea C-169]|uniref:Zn-dependent exopeptidase n=1 Tax=Coccomyxa subellipsoidea (strain C-169) TaxID=574566 RepID=I0Z9W5_COCSC|nr:Zn-dependent exopeptidase [Coccomyxa subellipsoidea C-169]EIE27434.1 Zn-dependent exopeptidase [Coccomyxa subellipsoidea C-169]|eukprot:XP_005651978.1 Zn-dependent exopeptidase [Coccomyxa subellipsoidea C-169]
MYDSQACGLAPTSASESTRNTDGAEIKLSRPVEDKNPVVIGRLGRNPDLPTVTFYGHYDVQPAMEREWNTDPFEVAAIDGYFYGRGTSDNKGPILAFVYAVKEMLKEGRGANGLLPVNVAFVFEGEEENGSAGFREAVQANLHWFEGTQLIIISNTLWVGEEVPCLTYGMRGMIAAAVEVKGPARDLHSGNEGGVFNEPLADLMKVLASLVDSSNRILVPGFQALVRPNTLEPALERLAASSEFSLDGYRAALGIPCLVKAQSTSELLRARWCEPALSVVDVRVGDDEEGAGDPFYRFGPTRFSVIPRSAVGNVSVRFVPDQDAEQLIAALRAHVDTAFSALGSSNTAAVRVKSVGDWWEADPESKLFKMAERALTAEWGRQPLFVREGGTMPVASALEKMLGAPALLVPFGQSSDACHLANERLQRINLIRGKNVIKNLLCMLENA